MSSALRKSMTVAKVDEELGLIIGYAIVCKRDGADYYDLQGDHIPEEEALKALVDFMANSRVAKEMHSGAQRGEVVLAMFVSESIAKSLGMTIAQSGVVIGVKADADLIAKYKSGELTEYSLGGGAEREAVAA